MAFIGPWEVALAIAVILVLFGPKKLPEIARSLGDAVKEFRQASTTATNELRTSEPLKEENLLLRTATRLGIKTEGKTPEELSNEIVLVIGEHPKEAR